MAAKRSAPLGVPFHLDREYLFCLIFFICTTSAFFSILFVFLYAGGEYLLVRLFRTHR